MSDLNLTLLWLFFLFSLFFLTCFLSGFRAAWKKNVLKPVRSYTKSFFYRPIHLYFFHTRETEGIAFALLATQALTRICLGITLGALLLQSSDHLNAISWAFLLLSSISATFLFGEIVPYLLGMKFSDRALKACGVITSILLLVAFPFYAPLVRAWSKKIKPPPPGEGNGSSEENATKEEIFEMIEGGNPGDLEPQEQKIFQSIVSFRDRIVREVMVPRVNIFCLPADTPIKEAAKMLQEEGYSRIPVYRNTVDHILGLLMYKDILAKYMEYEGLEKKTDLLSAPIETIIKPVLYTPETKKISLLLQEFQKKQMHLAIVVDEYGGTEGLVTIEDILEEIVGEIEDEYDEEETLFIQQPGGAWIVDARMNILDMEERLGIKIPQGSDYDTLGGYIFHRTGAIPPKGFTIRHDDFELEVISSSDRSIRSVRVQLLTKSYKEEK